MGDDVIANEEDSGSRFALCKFCNCTEAWAKEGEPVFEDEQIGFSIADFMCYMNPVEGVDGIDQLWGTFGVEYFTGFLLCFSWEKNFRILTFEGDNFNAVPLL